MPSVIESLFLIGCSLALIAPLGYALTTLIGMRGRRMYPILRVMDMKGRLLFPMWSGNADDGMELHPVGGPARFRSLSQGG